nr:MAG TPA: hypothetical protein [Caudoviricetes sp.]
MSPSALFAKSLAVDTISVEIKFKISSFVMISILLLICAKNYRYTKLVFSHVVF